MDTTQPKWLLLLQSRKFWALIFGLIALAISYQFGHVSLESVELQALGILSVYILSVAVEDHGVAMGRRVPQVTTMVASPPASMQVTQAPPAAAPAPLTVDQRIAEAIAILNDAGARSIQATPTSPPHQDADE